MAEYKVVEEFELDGVAQPVDSLVELTDEQAAEYAGKVEAVAPSSDDSTTPPAADTPAADTPADETPAAPSGESEEGGFVGKHSMADN